MAGLNHVILIGNLTRDPELRYTPDGTPVVNFTIAVNRFSRNLKDEKAVDFIPVVVWRERAQRCSEYLTKGSQIAAEGRLQIRSYEDKDGIKRKTAEVVAWRVEFLQRLKKQVPLETTETTETTDEKTENEIEKASL